MDYINIHTHVHTNTHIYVQKHSHTHTRESRVKPNHYTNTIHSGFREREREGKEEGWREKMGKREKRKAKQQKDSKKNFDKEECVCLCGGVRQR